LDNLYTWHVYLGNFPSDLPFAQDLKYLGILEVEIEIRWGPQKPITPPFVRVLQPRFLPFSDGSGGHVTVGGSLCMSVLTMDDWSPVYSIVQILIMVHLSLCSMDPWPARIAEKGGYLEEEAMDAYICVATTHGWRNPEDYIFEVTFS
jgi:ubiquitin-conjugating enzyme E2 Q